MLIFLKVCFAALGGALGINSKNYYTVMYSHASQRICCIHYNFIMFSQEFANTNLKQPWDTCVNCTGQSEAGGSEISYAWFHVCIQCFTHSCMIQTYLFLSFSESC